MAAAPGSVFLTHFKDCILPRSVTNESFFVTYGDLRLIYTLRFVGSICRPRQIGGGGWGESTRVNGDPIRARLQSDKIQKNL